MIYFHKFKDNFSGAVNSQLESKRIMGYLRYSCTLYTITLITMLIPTYSVWYAILFRETGVVHRITNIFVYFFLFIY